MTRHPTRAGAATVEVALVLPILVVLVVGLIAGGVSVFQHQQVACLAKEGARWASARGAQSETDTGRAPPTRDEIVTAAVLPLAVSLDPAGLEVTVEWVDRATGTATDWDAAPKDFRSVTAGGEYVTNAVRVTVRYRGAPGLFGDPVTVQGVCERPLTN